MKRTILTLFALWMATASLWAHEFSVGGIYYNITSSTNKTVAVTYRGSSYSSYSNEYSGSVTIPSSVTYYGTTYSVTSIGRTAFEDCTGLTSVTIPESVTEIGNYAFWDCTGLTTVNFNATNCIDMSHIEYYEWGQKEGIYSVFNGCTNLATVNIGENVTRIPEYAFYNCTGLTSVTIPESVTYIGRAAFSGTPWNTAWYTNQPDGMIYINKVLYDYKGTMPENTSIEIKEGTASISDYAFYNCTGLTSVTIPESVTSIGGSAFKGCTGLTTVNFNSANCTKMSDTEYYSIFGDMEIYFVFDECPNLTTVNIGENVTTIPDYAFSGCTGLTSVTIPESVTSIGNYAFSGCTGLTSVTIPESVTSIGSSAFYNTPWYTNQPDGVIYMGKVLYDYKGTMPEGTSIEIKEGTTSIYSSAFSGCTGLTSVTIPNSVTSIGYAAFRGCTGLTSVTIGNSVTSIGYAAFRGCTGLTSVTIPNSVTEIGDYAFYNCTGLTSVTIGNSVTTIGGYAFEYCTGLTSVTIGNSVTLIGGYAFEGCTGLTTVYFNATNCTTMGSDYPVFRGCTNLTTVHIGENVTRIPGYAFKKCTGLTSVTIPESVTLIGGYAFEGCTGLTTVNFNATNCTTMGSSSYPVFSGCTNLTTVHIGENVTRIPGYAFRYCTGLTSVTIPESVTSIGSSAFYNCSSITSLTIADGDTDLTIGESGIYLSNIKTLYLGRNLSGITFQGNTALTRLTLGNGITSIGENMFKGCDGLTSVTIPNSVTEIGGSAFRYCDGLTSVTIPNSVTTIGSYAFSGCMGLTSLTIADGDTDLTIADNTFSDSPIKTLYVGRNLSGISFQGKATLEDLTVNTPSIAEQAYQGCTGIKNLILGNRVNEIANEAFSGCTGLTELIIPDNVTMIRNSAFSGCTALTSVTLGRGLTRMAGDIFKECANIKSIYCYPTTPPSASTTTFPEVVQEDAILYVPTGCKSVYMTTSPWSNFWDIRELETLGVEDVLAESITVTVQGGAIVVNGIDTPMNIEVYNLQGQRVYSGYETTIPMNERGIYLVRIANRVVKVVL